MDEKANPMNEIRMSERVKRLRDQVVASKPTVCSERARLVTESYKATESQPMLIRRAKALETILKGMTIHIHDDELIVGNQANYRRGTPVNPEMGIGWLSEEIDSVLETRAQDKMVVPETVKRELKEIFGYWKGRTIREAVYGILPKAVVRARQAKLFTLDNHEEGGLGHIIPDHPMLLQQGFEGVKARIRKHLEALDPTHPEDFQKGVFYRAETIVADAAIHFGKRYANEAERLADIENNPKRRDELLGIAQICRRVPVHPPRNFHESLQAIWFVHLILHIETNGTAISPGRMDQFLYPFYRRDIDAGVLTQESAQELLDCLWLKFNEIIKLRSQDATYVHAGFPTVQNVTIGGVLADGSDGTNELSSMMLNSQAHIRLPHPQLSMRVHDKTSEPLLQKAAGVLALGGGMPQLIGDEILIESLVNRGLPLQVARDYAPIGCVELGVIGLWGRGNGGYFNIPKVLELALNNGVDPKTGKQIGAKTGDPRQFETFDDVLSGFKAQMHYCTRLLAIENNVIDQIHAELMPHVFYSMVIPDCIENGKDATSGGARYNWTGPIGVGIANAGDGLTAIKKVVFEDREATMDQLVDALEANFEGYETLHRKLLAAPKYGTDNEYADQMIKDAVNIYLDPLLTYPTPRGGNQGPSALFSLSVSLPFGWATGALPDGRKAGTPLADGISPVHGHDYKGPTAVLKSASKIEHVRTSGTILNLKFHPSVLSGPAQIQKFVDLASTYLVDLKGSHMQCNFVSPETLRDAQIHPEAYPDLIVRVTGYSARFVELSKEVQDDIIGRTTQVI